MAARHAEFEHGVAAGVGKRLDGLAVVGQDPPMPTATRRRRAKRRKAAALVLAACSQGLVPPERKAEVTAAARTMLLALNRKLGKGGRRKRASAGGKAVWATMTPRERRLENLRRAQVRNRNRLAKAALAYRTS